MRIAFDANILVYAEGANGDERRSATWALVGRLRSNELTVSAQVMGETFNVLTRKAGFSRSQAREAIMDWAAILRIVPTSVDDFQSGVDLAADHNMQIYDAIILSVSASAGCRLLLSEDMQHGFEWRGVTVINPFLSQPHPLLARALAG